MLLLDVQNLLIIELKKRNRCIYFINILVHLFVLLVSLQEGIHFTLIHYYATKQYPTLLQLFI